MKKFDPRAFKPDKIKDFSIRGAVKAVAGVVKRQGKKIQSRYRARFPKKPPKYFDGQQHELKFLRDMAIQSFLIYLYIETFARATSGIFNGVMMIWKQPVIFLYNTLIIFTCLSLSLLFKRRGFASLIITVIWVILGTVNGCILIKRMTPFTLYDLQNLGDGATLLTTYYNKWQIVIGAIVIALGVAILVLKFLTSVKWENIDYRKSVLTIAGLFVLTLGSTAGLLKANALSTFFGNLNYAYTDYGFPYCFINTSVNTGISRPDNYSKKAIDEILKKTKEGSDQNLKQTEDDSSHPNVIVLQMESFTYAQDYHNIKVNKDPTPNFTKLMKNYTTGWFEVPACGAGTANTEFEVLTGISAKFFGPGEYPYKGKLRTQTLESMAYVLKSRGYTASALHDHRALFYNRNEVYPDLGFDSFTSLEYMNGSAKTPTGWAQDKIMTDDIINIMKKTKTRDFEHIISVQGHGSYPTEQVFKNPYAKVTADDEETKWKYQYYVEECHQMDEFIGDLLKRIQKLDEPTIVLIYGDHIPALDVKESEYANGNLYQTRYVIWDNIGLSKNDHKLYSYQAGAELLKDAGYPNIGTMFDYQQNNSSDSKSYISDQKALAYDMLYGDNFIFGGKNPFKKANMTMGYKKIKIDKIVKIGDDYYIKGKNFTEHSTVSMDGKVLKTIYLSPTLLGLQESIDPEDVSKLQVSQIDTKDDTILTTINSNEQEEL